MQITRNTVGARKDVEAITTKPVVADIPLCSSTTSAEDAIRALRANILLNLKQGEKVIQVTSGTKGEGKTFCAANIAKSLAQIGKKVIAVDTDMRTPALAAQLGITDSNNGLSALLTKDTITESDVTAAIIISRDNAKPDVLPAGSVPENAADIVACGKISDVVNILKDKYDFIVIDSTSLDNDADAIYINKVADYTLHIVRADITIKKNVEAIDKLVADGKLKNVNVAVNAIDMSMKKYKYQYGK